MAAENRESTELIFAEPAELESDTGQEEKWLILIVDDEPDIHQITQLVLEDTNIIGRSLGFLRAYSGQQAREIMRTTPGIALVLLDVVMESSHAGLETASYIRNELQNDLVRIVLRTGHPGEIPEREVLEKYDINGYKTKTELTYQKLYSTVLTAIRTYKILLELETSRQELAKANQMLAVLDKAKSDFLGHLSHELRTPLNGILGFSSVLVDELADETHKEYARSIVDCADRLAEFTERARIMNSLRLEIYSFNRQPLALNELIDEVIQANGELAESAGITVSFNPQQGMADINVDSKLLSQCLQDLLENSLRHCQGTTVTIKTSSRADQVIAELSDDGQGFPAGIIASSASQLFQVDNIMHHKKGSGLGLVMARIIVESHQGSFHIENLQAGGAFMCLEFPTIHWGSVG